MAGQGGLDADAMWAELKKADSSKVIDASHIPTSVLDGRWVKKTGDTMTGTLTSASTNNAIIFKGSENCDITNFYTMNGTLDSNSRLAIRNGLRFNWYDTYWYIGNLRGESTDSNGFGIANESHKLCLQVTPNNTIAPVFRSTVATGLPPLIVFSNTTVDNLSADLLDGYHAFGTSNALIKYGYTVGGTEPAWCRIATYSIRNTETMTDVCFVLHSSYSDLFGLLVVKTRGTAVVEGLLIASYNINRSNIRIYHDAEKKNIELYCYGGSHYSIIQANLLYSHDRNGGVNTKITLYQADTKAPSWSTYVNPVFANLQNSSEAAKKLQTPRTLWGQSFDGTANVSGDMTGVGSITMSGDLKIGNATSPNTIYFYGTTGDAPGGYNHTFIAERFWGGTESGELVLFKGDDLSHSDTDATTVGGAGPDRIRHIAAAHLFQTYASPISGTVESICTSSVLRNLFSIAPGRVVSYIPLQSIVASGTAPFIVASNTVVGNLNADLLDGFHENSFLRHRDTYGINGYNTLWSQIGIRQYDNAKPDGMTNSPYIYGAVISLPSADARFDIWYNHHSSSPDYGSNGIQYRSGWGTDKRPWRMLLDNVNYASYSDGRYVKKAGDTMTGDLAMDANKGFYFPHGTRVVKTSGNWIHDGGDTASSTDANLRFGSWNGIGWYPTISGMFVAQGNNAMWLDVRRGALDVFNTIISHRGYLAANWDSARRLVLGGGGSYVWIDSRNSSNNVLCNIVLQDNKVVIGHYAESSRFASTVGTGTQPYQCNSTTLNTNLNADMLDNWHLNFLPRNYNIGRCYAVRFALGGTDNGWKKIFACSESGAGPYRSVTVWGQIWYAYGSHANDEVRNYHFCAIFQMRSGPSSSDSSVGTVKNSARLYLPTFAKGMDNIRLVRVGTNNFELQVRQIGSYHNANIEYQYWSYGCNVSAWENLQSTSNTSVAVSAGGASTLADSRASSADVLTTSRTLWGQSFDGTANVSGDMTGVGSITMSGDLKIGNATSPNTIYFYGTTGDAPGGYNHTFIAERFWGGTESGELVLFKGDDLSHSDTDATTVGGAGPDRIRHIAAAHLFQTYASPISGTVESICTSSVLRNLFSIAPGRVVSYIPLQSIVASGTAPFIVASNTVVGNLNADLLDGFHENSFLRHRDTYGINGYNTLWSQIGIRQYDNAKPDGMTNSPYIYGAVISLPSADARFDIWYNHHSSSPDYGSNGIQYRSGWGTDKRPWRMLLDNVNYASYSDGRYVKKAGDTMTGDLAMDANKGFYFPHGTRVVKTSGNWIHDGGDTASSTDANLRFGSWNGIGWYPTISGMFVAQGNNAMWLDVRRGALDVFNTIISHRGYLAANWDSARRLVLGGGGSYVWIDSRNSSNNVLCNIVLQDNKVVIGHYAESSRFASTVGTGTQPYQCNSTTLNTNLNADMLDNWHLNFLPRNYNIGRCYAVRFALGGTDNGWKKIFACSESGAGPYRSVTVWGQIWYAYGSHANDEVRNYHFCAIFQMRSGPSSSDSSVGTVKNSARLYLPTFAKGMDNIRLVRVGTNNFELQVRQIGSYHNANIEYQYWSYGCNVSAWENLQSTSNTSVAVSAGGASTLADSRASSADVLTTSRTLWGRPFNGSANIDGNIDNAAVITSKGGIRLDLKGSSGVAFYAGGSLCAVMNTTGVGIGTSSPSQKLHVAGNIIATGAITAKASSSDIRLKTDIQDYDAMGIIRKFRSVKYHWNNLAKRNSEIFNHKKWNYGLIAQDLLSGGYSQWVSDIFKDYYTIDYERLIPVVWKGLQEVDDEVTRLKKRVRELEKRLGIN